MRSWMRRRRAAKAWRRTVKARRCHIIEEWGGIFIGRRCCTTHNVVWDDGGRCPRFGHDPGEPFEMAGHGKFSGRH